MTMTKKMAAYGFSALMVLAVLVSMAPTAAAQASETITVNITIGQPDSTLLMPEVGVVTVPVDVELAMPAASGCTANVNVAYEATGPPYATPIMNPSTYSFTYQSDEQVPFATPGGDKVPLPRATLQITTTRDAPAFEDGRYQVKVTVTVQGASCNWQGSSSQQPVVVKNDYFPLMEAIPQSTVLKAGQNSQVQFPIEVTNFGNGQTRVFSDTKYNSKNELDALIPPPAFVVESKAQQGTAAKDVKTVFVQARTPHTNGYVNSIYSFQVDFRGEYAGTKPAGEPATDEQSVFLSLQVQGVYAPGFDPVFAIGALGVAMLGMRRFVKPPE